MAVDGAINAIMEGNDMQAPLKNTLKFGSRFPYGSITKIKNTILLINSGKYWQAFCFKTGLTNCVLFDCWLHPNLSVFVDRIDYREIVLCTNNNFNKLQSRCFVTSLPWFVGKPFLKRIDIKMCINMRASQLAPLSPSSQSLHLDAFHVYNLYTTSPQNLFYLRYTTGIYRFCCLSYNISRKALVRSVQCCTFNAIVIS